MTRWQVRDEIERQIRFLDETDNYIELKPDGDEDEDSDSAEFDIPDEDSELPPMCRVRGGVPRTGRVLSTIRDMSN